MSSILISGLHKSGTTGLYNAIKAAVRDSDDYAFLFEPKTPKPILSLGRYAPRRPLLAKVLVNRLENCALRLSDFDHMFMTIRDPRDVVVSRLLFRPMLGWTAYEVSTEQLNAFVAALKEKEADPGAYSVKALHDLADQLGIGKAGWADLVRQMRQQQQLIAEHGFTLVRYEDFVEGRVDTVEGRLGVEINNPQASSAGGWLGHIQRAMGHGEWRDWFLDEDVTFFADLFGDYLSAFGFTDWDRSPEAFIDPATSSEYIERKVTEHVEATQARHHRDWDPMSVRDQQELDHLRGMAEDGRARWAYRLAQVCESGPVFARDPDASENWAREAAQRGHVAAMRLLARRLAERTDHDSVIEARFWQREHDRLTGAQRETLPGGDDADTDIETRLREVRRRATETRAELAKVRASARYRVGSLLVEAVRDPIHQLVPSTRELARLVARRLRSTRST